MLSANEPKGIGPLQSLNLVFPRADWIASDVQEKLPVLENSGFRVWTIRGAWLIASHIAESRLIDP